MQAERVKHTLPAPPPKDPKWPEVVYCCDRCTLRWKWAAHVCPGCGCHQVRVESTRTRTRQAI